MMEEDEVAEAGVGGGGNRNRPPEVLCGEDPERRRDERLRRLQKELIEQQRLASREELRRRIREINNRLIDHRQSK